MKTDQTGQILRLIEVFAGCTSFCWFCCAAAQLLGIFLRPDLHSNSVADPDTVQNWQAYSRQGIQHSPMHSGPLEK